MSSKVTCTCGWSWNKSDSSKKDMYVCHQCGKDNTMKDGGWLSKYNTPEAQNGIEGTMAGLTDQGFDYNGAWGGTMAMGGSLPGSVGFTYARTQDPAPSNGPYAKKTKASAQNGQEMKFYQEGLDWKPKTISRDGGKLSKAQTAKTVKGEYKKFSLPSLLKENFNSKQDNTVVNTNLQQLSSANPLDTITNQRNINIKLTGNSNLPYSHKEFDQLQNTYNDAERDAKMKYSANKKFINIKDTKYNTRHNQRVNTAILDDIVKAAVKSKIDPYTALAIAQRETGIGYYSDRRIHNKARVEETRPSSIFSNWELMNQGLNREDLGTIGNEVPARVYNKAKKYYDSILQYPFQGEMKTINDKTKKGTFIRGYNYGDPDYPNKVAKEKEILMSDENKVFRNYVDSVATSKFKDGGWLNKYEEGGIIEDDRGQLEYPGEITKINSNQITMRGVDYPVLGISDTGDTQMMQPGQDYSYDGSSVTEYPMAQKGKKIQSKKTTLRYLMNDDDDLKSKSDATKVVKATAPNKVVGSPTRDQGTISVPYEKSIREKAISNLKQYDDPVRGLVTAPAVSALNLLRPDRYFENVNSESDIKDAFLNFGLDAAMVAPIAGEFSPYINKTLKSARQYLPEKGQFINEIKDLKRAIAPTQPTFINPTEQELLSTVRNVGIMSKTGANDATVLEKILNKSAQLGEKEFENLVGSTRSQIKEKIQTIKASGSAKKPNVNTETTIASELGIDQDPDWLRIQERLRDRARSLSTPNYDEFGNIISEPSTADIARAIQASGEIDLSTINSSQAQRARRIQELRDNSSNIVLRPIDELVDPPSYFTLDDMRYNENFDLSPEEMGLLDNMYFHRPTNKSLIRGLTERVNKNKYLPLVADESDNLLPVLYRDASNNPAVEMLKAYRTLESAPKGSTFKGASSLSTDSYPATLRMTQKALKSDIADVNYIGMGDLNFSGFSQIANVPKDVNLKEINTIIDQLNKKLPKPIPYAYEKDYKIIAPQITVTRKKNGGWLSKYN